MKLPGTEVVASSWVAPSGVPGAMSAESAQVIVGVACATSIVTVAVAV